MPTILPSGLCDVGWCHISVASAGLGPNAGVRWCSRGQGGGRASRSALPQTSIAHSPLHGSTVSRSKPALLQLSQA